MIEYLAPEIRQCWNELSEIRTRLFAGCSSSEDALRILRAEIEGLKTIPTFKEDPTLQQVLQRLELVVSEIQRRARPGASMQEFVLACDELRMKFLIMLVASRKSPSAQRTLEGLLSDTVIEQKPTITCTSYGLSYARVDDSWAIMLPELEQTEDTHRVLDDLSQLYDLSTTSPNWIFDFSATHSVPFLMLGALVGYHTGPQPRHVEICWLRADVSCELPLERLCSLFNCELVGGHWFSRPE